MCVCVCVCVCVTLDVCLCSPGVVVSLQVVILIEMLGLPELTSAYGLANMYHGIGTFVGPPLAGNESSVSFFGFVF